MNQSARELIECVQSVDIQDQKTHMLWVATEGVQEQKIPEVEAGATRL